MVSAGLWPQGRHNRRPRCLEGQGSHLSLDRPPRQTSTRQGGSVRMERLQLQQWHGLIHDSNRPARDAETNRRLETRRTPSGSRSVWRNHAYESASGRATSGSRRAGRRTAGETRERLEKNHWDKKNEEANDPRRPDVLHRPRSTGTEEEIEADEAMTHHVYVVNKRIITKCNLK